MPSAPLLARLRHPSGGARTWLGVVLALAIALRLLVPQGWMPMAGGGLMLCPGAAPVAVPMHHGKHDAPGQQGPEHPCAFAGLGLAATASVPVCEIVPPAPLRAGPAPAPAAVAIGRGLAAPPPPATGPPAFA